MSDVIGATLADEKKKTDEKATTFTGSNNRVNLDSDYFATSGCHVFVCCNDEADLKSSKIIPSFFPLQINTG